MDADTTNSNAPTELSSPSVEVARTLLTLARQLIHQPNPSQALQPMAASNSPVPSETLMPMDNYPPYLSNSLYFDIENTATQFPIITEIIKAHPLNHVITYNPNDSQIHVPEVYLQQFWHALKESTTDDGRQSLVADVDTVEIELTCRKLRTILDVPRPNKFPPKTAFDPTPSGQELYDLVRQLGYNGPLTKIGDFKRTRVVPMWQTLCTILFRTLTGSHRGTDGGSFYSLQLLAGVAFHMHLDYGQLIWSELVRMVNEKPVPSKRKNFVPFQRFLTMILEQIIERTPEIAPRTEEPKPQGGKIEKITKIPACLV